MARKISNNFLEAFKSGTLSPILNYVKQDDTLSMCLRENRVTVYYRGGALLTIYEENHVFEVLDSQYGEILTPTILTIADYIPKAKHFIDKYVTTERNHLGEKDIQQQIERENNYSPNSLDTDYFIIDTEYQDLGRFDIVAIRWDSTSSARGLIGGYTPKITIFEVKQGCDSITGKSGMKKHIDDFEKFIKNADCVEKFIEDMVLVFNQKRLLGLVKGADKYKEITFEMVDKVLDFIFILSNYKSESTKLRSEMNSIIADCRLIYSNPMDTDYIQKILLVKQIF